ncbi:MAG: P-loop NTPase [Ehrlichia sp.]
MLSKEHILNALLTVIDHDSNKNIVELGLVKYVSFDKGVVNCVLDLPNEHLISQRDIIERKCKEAVNLLQYVKQVKIIVTSTCNTRDKSVKGMSNRRVSVSNLKNIILISSGKGGVGKSTIALNIALSLLRKGYKSALVDLDIYGPSIPYMLGVKDDRNPEVNVHNKMIPIVKYGIKSMSIGYLISKDNAAIWRGPMITKVIYSLMMNTEWGEIDYLIVDTPPGTGDVHISLGEKFNVAGVVVVSTPQGLAIIDAVKICDMMRKMNIPIIGMVENMSYLIDSSSGNKTYIFGKQGVNKMATALNIDFLGEVAIYPQVCNAAELGNPLALNDEIYGVYDGITDNVLSFLKKVRY